MFTAVCFGTTRNLAITDRSHVSTAHTVTTVNFQGEVVLNGGRSTWDTGGGGHTQKHKFQCGIVFYRRKHCDTASTNFTGDGIFSQRGNSVIPLVVAA